VPTVRLVFRPSWRRFDRALVSRQQAPPPASTKPVSRPVGRSFVWVGMTDLTISFPRLGL